MAVVVAPYIGESINEFRRRKGIKPLDIPGWDVPRTRDQTHGKSVKTGPKEIQFADSWMKVGQE